MITAVIVDSGIRSDHPAFNDDKIISICPGGGPAEDEYGHGTAIYGILSKVSGINIVNIKLPHIESGVDISDLIAALNYIAEYIPEAKLVNLSLGVNVLDGNELYSACKRLTDSGVVIVSAFDNTNSISYPAAFENVIGVVSDDRCRKIDEFVYIEGDIVNIASKGGPQRLCWSKPDYIISDGNSFACAHVSSMIAQLMVSGIMDLNTILKTVRQNAISEICDKSEIKPQRELFEIQRAVLFPFNKEMHSLIRFSDMLPFDIVGVYDTKYSPCTGSTTAHILNDKTLLDMRIENIDKLCYEGFDTMILGHTDQLMSLLGDYSFIDVLIESLLNAGKKIYSFDNISEKFNSECVYSPIVDECNVPSHHLGMLYNISKPVLSVMGTSSVQGKYTLQLKLKKALTKRGYTVGQLGTEPSSLLFGADYVYPMGYNSSVYIDGFQSVRYLNHIMNVISQTNANIILTGAQSGTVNYDIRNIVNLNIQTYNFLLGTNPDAVIICINPYDDKDYIDRTIKFIESSVNCAILGFVVYPMDFTDDTSRYLGNKKRISDNKYHTLKNELSEIFKCNIYRLDNDDDIELIVDNIIEYFSEE